MDILIINTNQTITPTPVLPAGACLVAESAERAGHRVALLDLTFEADPGRAIENLLRKVWYDVIGLSVRNIDNNDMQQTAFYIKDLVPLLGVIRKFSRAFLILGGASLTVMPEQIMRTLGIDCAVLGDGERTFPLLLQKIARQEPYEELSGVACISDGVFRSNPPSAQPFSGCAVPDYDRWLNLRAYRSQLATMPLQTKLGCHFQCIYCTYRKIEGESYRLYAPEAVVKAATQLTSSGVSDIEIVDNVFNAPYDHALAVCDAFIRSKVRARFQSVELNPASFDDTLVTAMERAGFVGMGLTVESASDPVLQGLRKSFTARDVYKAAEVVSRHRIPCVWIFMLGGPGETRETVRESIRFAEKHVRPGDSAFFNIGIRIYPGTELESIARKQGLLSKLPQEMLEPVFYVSPQVDHNWIRGQVRNSLNTHMNFIGIDTFSFPYLPLLHKIGYRLGLRSPLWRYASSIRMGLRFLGIKV